jgi:putative transposon-encoded protein
VIAEASVESAAAVMQKLRERFGESAKVSIADDAFQATDKYLGKVCIVRKGRYLAGYGNLAEGQDGVKLATALASRLP